VRRRFAEAEARGVAVRRHGVRSRDLLRHLRTRGPAIALVDASLLTCDLCNRNKLRAEFRYEGSNSLFLI
jgi:hypothetical protein